MADGPASAYRYVEHSSGSRTVHRGGACPRERSGALARAIEENVGHIIEHCELPPKADAALHVVIGRMLTAANQLKTDASPDAAVAQLRSALHDYRDAFDHSAAVSSRQD